MTRLNIIVEGQTEEAFANRTIVPYLSGIGVYPSVQLIRSRENNASRRFKGGWNSFEVLQRHLIRWMRSDSDPNVWYSTMLDLYALPEDFPGFAESLAMTDPYVRVEYLEQQMRSCFADLGFRRFHPYLQLHEFEALLLVDPSKFDWEFLEHDSEIESLVNLVNEYDSPELINHGATTAPSKRIIRTIPEYEGRKVSAGPVIASKIGLVAIREKCRHFDAWLRRLEHLTYPSP